MVIKQHTQLPNIHTTTIQRTEYKDEHQFEIEGLVSSRLVLRMDAVLQH